MHPALVETRRGTTCPRTRVIGNSESSDIDAENWNQVFYKSRKHSYSESHFQEQELLMWDWLWGYGVMGPRGWGLPYLPFTNWKYKRTSGMDWVQFWKAKSNRRNSNLKVEQGKVLEQDKGRLTHLLVTFLFYPWSQCIEQDKLGLGRPICYMKSPDSHLYLFRKTLPEIWEDWFSKSIRESLLSGHSDTKN